MKLSKTTNDCHYYYTSLKWSNVTKLSVCVFVLSAFQAGKE